MLKPFSHPKLFNHQENYVKNLFSILVWNIHKENQNQSFKKELEKILLARPSDFLLFQEFKHSKLNPHNFSNFSFALGSNIETKKYSYGVCTAVQYNFEDVVCKLSSSKEMGITTHKSFMISKHLCINNIYLYVVNIHAINFVTLKKFTKELENIKEILLKYKGPMLVVGDFNTWSSKRIQALTLFQNELNLTKAKIDMPQHIKHVFSKPLDYIFYRELKLGVAQSIDTKKISDHNPIYAQFSLLSD